MDRNWVCLWSIKKGSIEDQIIQQAIKQMRKIYHIQRNQSYKRSVCISRSQVCAKFNQNLRYFVGGGNNSNLIRRILSNRSEWTQVQSKKQALVNFRWQQGSTNFKFENCIENSIFRQSLNHFENHHQLSNKELLFKNLYEYCQTHKINVFSFIPLTFELNLADSSFQNKQAHFVSFYNKNKPNNQNPQELHLRRRRLKPNSMFNFSSRNSNNYCKYEISQHFMAENSPYLWILKPTFYNRGNGIHVFSSLSQMQDLMRKYIQGVTQGAATNTIARLNDTVVRKSFRIRQIKDQNCFIIRSNSFVVQKYLERPLLFAGRKFDIRMWVLFTHELKVYVFKRGYLRTSSYQYNLGQDQISDLNVHLTNSAVQKYNDDYSKYQQGNQLSFDTLKELIESHGKDYQSLMQRIKQIVKITALSVRKKISKHNRSYCFQIFGYDFMLDQDCNPWLIEVNTNPCIEQSSAILQELLPRMLDDAFALTIDQIFDLRRKNSFVYPVEKQKDDESLWQKVVDIGCYS